MRGLSVISICLVLYQWVQLEATCIGNHMKATGICPTRMFGPKCDCDCNCAQWDETCDQVTGCCSSGCANGYIGTNCSIKLAVMNTVPTSPWQTNLAIQVRFQTWNPEMGGTGPVSRYRILFKLFDVKDWAWGPEEPHRDVEFMEKTLAGLVPETTYSISVVPIIDIYKEGFQSPELLVKTKSNLTTMPGEGTINGQAGDQQLVNKLTYALIAVGVVLFIAIITIIVYAVCYKRLADSQKRASNEAETSKRAVKSDNNLYERPYSYTNSSQGYERPVVDPSAPQYGPYLEVQ